MIAEHNEEEIQVRCRFLICLQFFLQMRQALEVRLAVAEEEIKAAYQLKFEKEESARKALAEQEAIMEKVVQESKMLKQEAEENSKVYLLLLHTVVIWYKT